MESQPAIRENPKIKLRGSGLLHPEILQSPNQLTAGNQLKISRLALFTADHLLLLALTDGFPFLCHLERLVQRLFWE